jgi:hypothetical protein
MRYAVPPERPQPLDIALELTQSLREVAEVLSSAELHHFAWRLTQVTNDVVYLARHASERPFRPLPRAA